MLVFNIPGHYGRFAWIMVITRFPGGFFGLLAFLTFGSSALLKWASSGSTWAFEFSMLTHGELSNLVAALARHESAVSWSLCMLEHEELSNRDSVSDCTQPGRDYEGGFGQNSTIVARAALISVIRG